MPILNPNSTNYQHPWEPNLADLHTAMTYDEAGVPHIRVTLGADNITVTGNVNVATDIRINNTEQQSIPVHLTDDPIAVTQSGTWNVGIGTDGTVSLSATTLSALENITVSGSVSVSNFPATQAVTGTFWQATQPVSIATMPTTPVTGTFWQATQPVSIATMPTTPVTGTFWQETQPVSGTVTIQDGGNTITVDGTVTANVTFPTTQQVSGTVALDTATLTALENTTVTVTGSVVVDNDSSNPLEVNAQITNVDPINVNANITGGTVTVTQAAGDFTYVKYIDETNTQLDSVGRLRVSPPTQSYWYVPSVDKDGDLRYIESFSGTGATSAFVQNISSILFTSGTDSNGSAIRISRRRHKMRPGVSVQWMGTGSFNGVDTNCIKRRGMFTNYNGFMFAVDTDLKFIIRRRLIDGTLVEDTFNRDTWTFDKLDGTNSATNPTGLNLNPTTSAVDFVLGSYVSKTAKVISATETHYNVVFNTATECPYRLGTKATVTGFGATGYNSLGMIVAKTANTVTFTYPLDPGTFTNGTGTMRQTGLHHKYTWWVDFDGDRSTRVRFGINTAEGPHVCHIVEYTGELGTHWENAPGMSDRFEMTNTGSITVRPTMTWSATCINVEAELELNPGFGVAHAQTNVDFNKNTDIGAEFAVLGIGLRAGEPYQRADLQIQRVQFSDLGNLNPQNAAIFEWSLVLNPTFGGQAVPAATDIAKATRMWDYATGTTVSGGIRLTGGYFQGTQQMEVQNALNFLNLGSNIEYNDADKVVLVAKMLVGGSSNSIMRATMNFIEAL